MQDNEQLCLLLEDQATQLREQMQRVVLKLGTMDQNELVDQLAYYSMLFHQLFPGMIDKPLRLLQNEYMPQIYVQEHKMGLKM